MGVPRADRATARPKKKVHGKQGTNKTVASPMSGESRSAGNDRLFDRPTTVRWTALYRGLRGHLRLRSPGGRRIHAVRGRRAGRGADPERQLGRNVEKRDRAICVRPATCCSACRPLLRLHQRSERRATAIRPAGYYNLKTQRLLSLCATSSIRTVRACMSLGEAVVWTSSATGCCRSKGVSARRRRTTSCCMRWIRPVFVIDAYTRRLLVQRHGVGRWDRSPTRSCVRGFEAGAAEPDVALFQQYHALLVDAREGRVCRKNAGVRDSAASRATVRDRAQSDLGLSCAFVGADRAIAAGLFGACRAPRRFAVRTVRPVVLVLLGKLGDADPDAGGDTDAATAAWRADRRDVLADTFGQQVWPLRSSVWLVPARRTPRRRSGTAGRCVGWCWQSVCATVTQHIVAEGVADVCR
jgi:endonuclease III-like uncharacterized protein